MKYLRLLDKNEFPFKSDKLDHNGRVQEQYEYFRNNFYKFSPEDRDRIMKHVTESKERFEKLTEKLAQAELIFSEFLKEFRF